MDFFDSLKENLNKTLAEVEKKAQELRQDINEEVALHRLRKRRTQLEDEIQTVYRAIGEEVVLNMQKNLPFPDVRSSFDYIQSIKKQMGDLDLQMNEIYKPVLDKPLDKAETIGSPKDKDHA